MTPPLETSSEARALKSYESGTAKHALTIRHEDGIYRHLRIQEPGTWTYGHDIVTWPGYLAITGDAGDFVFSRIPDMFEFFDHGSDTINPHYWSEKLQAPRQDGVRRYSSAAYRQRVGEWADEIAEEIDTDAERKAFWTHVDADLLCDYDDDFGSIEDEQAVRGRLRDFTYDGGPGIYDPYEWEFWDWDHHFLWCCWAIVRGIARYKAAQAVPA